MMLCVFNPEHDLCLANGNSHFMAPRSALRFAQEGAAMMQVIYSGSVAVDAAQAAQAYRDVVADRDAGSVRIVPWGWNAVLKVQLLKAGIPEVLMPSDGKLAVWRKLQHRSTLLPLQPESRAVAESGEVEEMAREYGEVVMKAPWSGSGRGLRWVSGALSEQDRMWMRKVVGAQGCVVAEPRHRVAEDFALEYMLEDGSVDFVGYSLFRSVRGVYRSNLLLRDETIAQRVGMTAGVRKKIEGWLECHIAPQYAGPLGVDCILSEEGRLYVSEMNLRHTMGLVAHEYLASHPEDEGRELLLRENKLQVAEGE